MLKKVFAPSLLVPETVISSPMETVVTDWNSESGVMVVVLKPELGMPESSHETLPSCVLVVLRQPPPMNRKVMAEGKQSHEPEVWTTEEASNKMLAPPGAAAQVARSESQGPATAVGAAG